MVLDFELGLGLGGDGIACRGEAGSGVLAGEDAGAGGWFGEKGNR